MITKMHPLGSITLSNEYFADLVSQAAQSCFGVAGMSSTSAVHELMGRLLGGDTAKGVTVSEENDRVVIELHIQVAYGVNIRSMVKSITHRVRNEVQTMTDLPVARVNICVDDIITD